MALSGHTLITEGGGEGGSGEGGLGRRTCLQLFPLVTWAPLVAPSLEVSTATPVPTPSAATARQAPARGRWGVLTVPASLTLFTVSFTEPGAPWAPPSLTTALGHCCLLPPL